MSQDTETLQVLLVNYLQSRELKWKKGEQNIFTHFPKDSNCDFCMKTKRSRASCRRRAGAVVPPRTGNFGAAFSMNEVNHATIIDTPLWCKT